jgi:riboflavin kinase/FMN adenylyltransferase
MDVIHFPDDRRPARWTHPVLALGNFDGVHRGHRKILDRVRRVAIERGATAVVMTFDPHPPRVVRPDKAPALLMTTPQKLEAIGALDLQGAAIVRFTADMSRWDPETFVKTVLVDWLHVGEVWVGANFLFGHERAGNFTLLRALGSTHGFKAEKIDPVRYKESGGSSARGASTKRAPCSVISTTLTERSCRAISGAAQSDFQRRISAPTTSCSLRTASTRRRRRSTRSCGHR